MDGSENVPTYNQNENFTPASQAPSLLTRDQEHRIMVSALRQVISSPGGGTSSSNWIASETLPPPNAEPCPLCNRTGCYGCAFPRHEEVKKEKKHKGVRKKPSGKWSAGIWDPSIKARRWLGTFPTYEMAVQVYEEAATELSAKDQ
ncbi:unnamed protein product [Microthlaspi erraticum]|uniref:AP2/ERF domain-containing protein n=1 Tax=Microthlaspi erraticum TaxID=1685480 RepID=A0A6D2KXM6_9BRAS|nr:unnamed protein product [Microthlaspi erraticum]